MQSTHHALRPVFLRIEASAVVGSADRARRNRQGTDEEGKHLFQSACARRFDAGLAA